MPYITSAVSAKASRKAIDVHGQTYHLSPYVGSAPLRGSYIPGNEKNDDGLPQGFLAWGVVERAVKLQMPKPLSLGEGHVTGYDIEGSLDARAPFNPLGNCSEGVQVTLIDERLDHDMELTAARQAKALCFGLTDTVNQHFRASVGHLAAL